MLISLIFPIIVSIASYLFISYIDKKTNAKRVNLREHYIFNRLQTVKRMNIEINFKLKNAEKEVVFKQILKSQIDCILEEVLFIVEDIEENSKKYEHQGAMQERLNLGLNNIFSKLYTFYICDSSYTDEDKRTIKAVLDKFYTINKDRVDRLYEGVLMINTSIFYNTPEEKAYAFFDSLISLVLDQLSVAEISFNNINGDLKGLTFRGGTIK